MRPLLWTRFNGPEGKPWRALVSNHWVSKELLDDDDKPALGVSLIGRRTILVNAAKGRAALIPTLLHELMHVHLDSLSLPYWLEETCVEATTEGLTSSLLQLGWHVPPLPTGWEALRRPPKRKR